MTTPPAGENADAAAERPVDADAGHESGGAAAQETSQVPPAAPPPPPLSPPHLPPPPPAPWLAPVARPPRVLWVNPARRPHVLGTAAVAGLVLLGAGIGIGWAASGDGSEHGRPYRIEIGPANFPHGPLRGYFPAHRPGDAVPPTGAPTPTPTSTR